MGALKLHQISELEGCWNPTVPRELWNCEGIVAFSVVYRSLASLRMQSRSRTFLSFLFPGCSQSLSLCRGNAKYYVKGSVTGMAESFCV